MRTARTLFASAVLTAVLAVGAPTATALPAAGNSATVSATSAHHGDDHGRFRRGDRDYDHDRFRRGDRDYDHCRFRRGDRDHGHRWHGRHHRCLHHHHRNHHRPFGGVHAGGGALMHGHR
ncbi:hypothetical protein ACWDBF_08310 [Streptomyces angustmyceticus]|uniref:hypothetical protein n=1 Tax=Streptomyces angustmyceticus TaxID=285578 RepID=UPI0021AE486E|nr:hypothetical protein [Streptomyces angustmyceticus]